MMRPKLRTIVPTGRNLSASAASALPVSLPPQRPRLSLNSRLPLPRHPCKSVNALALLKATNYLFRHEHQEIIHAVVLNPIVVLVDQTIAGLLGFLQHDDWVKDDR